MQLHCVQYIATHSLLTVSQAFHGNSNNNVSSLQCKMEPAIGEFKLDTKRRSVTTSAVRGPPECASETEWERIKKTRE